MRPGRLLSFALPWLALAASLAAAEVPPAELKLVGDHWTAWDPPASFPEGTEVYVIQTGDTLWDLAARFHANPYLWPQLWERNRYILDAHWIYPGDPLAVGLQVTPIEELAAAAPPAPQPSEPRMQAAVSPPVPLGSESDIYCSGFIGDLNEPFPYQVVGSEYENLAPSLVRAGGQSLTAEYGALGAVKIDLDAGDIVYVNGGEQAGLLPGSVYTAIWPDEVVKHPRTGFVVGRLYRYLGRVRVLSVQEQTAIAEIAGSCHPLRVGAFLRPFEPEPVPLARRTPPRPINDPASAEAVAWGATILLSDDRLVSLGQDHVVFIDRGSEHDVTPGDLFTIYRLNREGLPPVVLGELAVLSVHRTTSVARIVESRHTVYVGDLLDPK